MATDVPARCEQCGAALPAGEAALGCIQCLLGGGLDPTSQEAPELRRRYQHYEIETHPDGSRYELGRGAMGVTYRALDLNLRLPVALKVIGAAHAMHQEARQRFLLEARVAARLRHPNVASVFHFGTEPPTVGLEDAAALQDESECFYAMELVEGVTLEKHVRRHGPLGPVAALELARQVARALSAAEQRGLVHRDLKPSNIMLAGPQAQDPSASPVLGEAWAKVIDFGLAKAVRLPEGRPGGDPGTLSGPATGGGFLGTPQFASPEQLAGEVLDARSDIYSLGVTLWFALTGALPYGGRSITEMLADRKQRTLPIEQLRAAQLPPCLVDLLSSMLARDPAARPATAAALHDAIEACLRTLRERPGGAGARTSRWGLAAAAGLAALLLAGGGLYLTRSRPAPAALPPVSRETASPGIAVLPFESFSTDPAQAFFADGIQDDILNTLARIRSMRVISRSSAARFRPGAPRDLPEIARQLGVTHVLEGTVRRDGDRVLVNTTLTECASGSPVWAERYDRTLADVISLQGELATSIAAALRTSLQPDERTSLSTKPTENAQAYVLYLQARDHDQRPTDLAEDQLTAERLYAEAVRLDPLFALARARLASTRAYIYRNLKPTPELEAQAFAEAREALRLRPDLGEAHLAYAHCLYRINRDYEAAQRELENAGRTLSNSPEILMTVANIQRRQGLFQASQQGFERARRLDPLNAQIAQGIFVNDRVTRNWVAAARSGARAAQLSPPLPVLRVEVARVALTARGELGPVEAVLASVPAGEDPDGLITYHRWDTAMIKRDFAGATAAVRASPWPVNLPAPGGLPLPKSYLLGLAALARGEAAEGHALLEAALPTMEAEVTRNPRHAFRRARLGLLYAYLGRKEDAIRSGKMATEITPESKDAFGGPYFSAHLALIYARCGEPELAIDWLYYLLRTTGPVYYMEPSITLAELRLRWQWDPLRGHPRFEQMLAEGEPATRVW